MCAYGNEASGFRLDSIRKQETIGGLLLTELRYEKRRPFISAWQGPISPAEGFPDAKSNVSAQTKVPGHHRVPRIPRHL
jgi:hypothetical protein